VNYTLRD